MILEFALAAVLHATPVVPCDSDADCYAKNTALGPGYGTDMFFPPLISPGGAGIQRVEEDGSVSYWDGWIWDSAEGFSY